MSLERTFQIQLKNDQVIELKFTSISVANDQLWQMFATTEALDTVEQLINQADPKDVAPPKKASPNLITGPAIKATKKKK